ncbi:hypothetical protein [Amycolatopsis orientalis]|uniref:hypothetical protein n=1 Tax=Amycolatopsis orientalis TaxID=31958 RepID=UPI001319F39A|nr:hypothetical protein [Amycolatopsis orientalis]
MTDDPRPATSPDPEGQAVPGRSRKPRRTALWIGLASAAFFVAGFVFLLLPVTALYYLDDHENPYRVETLYGTRSDQMLILPKALLDVADSGALSSSSDLVTSVRVGCGTAFSSPDAKLSADAHGAEGCAAAERPRMIMGWLGVGLGVLGAVGVGVLRRRQPRPNAAQTHFPPSAGA